MKRRSIIRPEVEIEADNFIEYAIIAVGALFKVGIIRMVTVIPTLNDQPIGKLRYLIVIVPKFTYKKARPEDADL